MQSRPKLVSEGISEAEWQARIDLAAAYRLCAHFGWELLIYNHIAMRVPGEPCFLVKPHSLLFTEVCASNLVKLRLDGQPVGFSENVNLAGFTIHTAILNARPDINCTLHVHTVPGMAMSAHKEGVLPLTQSAMRFYNRVSYHDFQGYATEQAECEILARDLGPRNKVMVLRNHGLLTCGESASEAVYSMMSLVLCCESQLLLEASGAEMVIPPPEVCEHAAQQAERHQKMAAKGDWEAFLRILDRQDTSYRA